MLHWTRQGKGMYATLPPEKCKSFFRLVRIAALLIDVLLRCPSSLCDVAVEQREEGFFARKGIDRECD